LLDSTCKQILEEIAIGVSNDKLLTVSDVMSFKQLGSPATLHRKLDVLLNAKLVESIFQGNNRRTKYINLTNSGQAYFERLSSAIQSVHQSLHQ
jgi:DNA-binding PadR family transcriptional regulator